MRTLATLCVLAMIATGFVGYVVAGFTRPAWAQERVIFHEPERTEWTFAWETATGPVVGYLACVVYTCGEVQWETCQPTVEPTVTLRPHKWVPWHVQVRAFGEDAELGPPSEPSVQISIDPNPADIDLNCVCGGTDFIKLSQEWGKVGQPAQASEGLGVSDIR